MKKTIFVTGVTRMYHGFVCVSGIDLQTGQFVRPEIEYPNERPGIKKEFLYVNKIPIIKPLVKVELDFLKHVPQSQYHTEDWLINPEYKPRLIGIPNDTEKRQILQSHTDTSLSNELYDQERSLIIIRPQEVPWVILRLFEDSLRCRLKFKDQSGDEFDLPVTDANWLAICIHYWRLDKNNSIRNLRKLLHNKELFLRIGITREYQGQKWKQVSGVFTIPDYLGGKCFADYNYDFDDHV
jgi:hypothetical protein